MTRADAEITFIGTVEQDPAGACIAIAERFRSGLASLDGFSHALILWWAHEVASPEERTRLTIASPYRGHDGEIGVFGSRSPMRPNPIGVTVAPLSGVDIASGRVLARYLDAAPGTPVLDIKPYYPASDRVALAHTPSWAAEWPQSLEESAAFDWSRAFRQSPPARTTRR